MPELEIHAPCDGSITSSAPFQGLEGSSFREHIWQRASRKRDQRCNRCNRYRIITSGNVPGYGKTLSGEANEAKRQAWIEEEKRIGVDAALRLAREENERLGLEFWPEGPPVR